MGPEQSPPMSTPGAQRLGVRADPAISPVPSSVVHATHLPSEEQLEAGSLREVRVWGRWPC